MWAALSRGSNMPYEEHGEKSSAVSRRLNHPLMIIFICCCDTEFRWFWWSELGQPIIYPYADNSIYKLIKSVLFEKLLNGTIEEVFMFWIWDIRVQLKWLMDGKTSMLSQRDWKIVSFVRRNIYMCFAFLCWQTDNCSRSLFFHYIFFTFRTVQTFSLQLWFNRNPLQHGQVRTLWQCVHYKNCVHNRKTN